MVTSVSGVTSQSNPTVRAMDKLTAEQIAHPGYYVVSPVKGLYEVPEPEYKRKGGFFRFLGKVILTAAIVGAAAIGIRKGLMGKYRPDDAANAGNTFKNWFAKKADKLYDAINGLFKEAKNKVKTENNAPNDANPIKK